MTIIDIAEILFDGIAPPQPQEGVMTQGNYAVAKEPTIHSSSPAITGARSTLPNAA